jgi:peptidoglycan/LPS O-acetylase OafA/YrhL
MIIGIPVLAVLGLTGITEYIGFFSYITFFLIGIVGYLIYVNTGNKIIEHGLLLALIVFSFIYYELAACIAAVLTILCILYMRKPVSSALEFPGELSYSIYLIHFPLGIKLINFLQRHLSPSYYWTAFLIAMVVCFALGYVFWKFIEKPSAKLSNNVKYGRARTKFENFSLKPE